MPLPTAEEIRAAHVARFKQQQQDEAYRRFSNPHKDLDLEKVWAAYVWVPDVVGALQTGEWVFAGFRRKRNRRKPQTMGRFFGKVRRQLQLEKTSQILLMDLGTARRNATAVDQTWRFRAPQYQQRKRTLEQRTPAIDRTKRKQRATVRAYKLSKHTTEFVALGRNAWTREAGYLYLGPLQSTAKRAAQHEAKRTFVLYKDLLVLAVDELSKSLRNAMARGKKMRAGASRVVWPEVPPTFGSMWKKFVTRFVRKDFGGHIALDDVRLVDIELALQSAWEAQERPWLTLSWFRKQIKPWRKECDAPKRKVKPAKRREASVAKRKATTNSSQKKSCVRPKSGKRKSSAKRKRSRSGVA